jgi:hypothetical protein
MLDRVRPKSHILLDLSNMKNLVQHELNCQFKIAAHSARVHIPLILQCDRCCRGWATSASIRRCRGGAATAATGRRHRDGGGIVMGGRWRVSFGADRNERKREGLSSRVRPEGEASSRGRFTYQLFLHFILFRSRDKYNKFGCRQFLQQLRRELDVPFYSIAHCLARSIFRLRHSSRAGDVSKTSSGWASSQDEQGGEKNLPSGSTKFTR